MASKAGKGIHKLAAVSVTKLKEPGYYGDGGGLYLQVSPSLSKSWIFRFKLHGRSREMGLGSLNALSLSEAREKAADCRRQLLDGIDPIEARRSKKDQEQRDAALRVATSMTFAACAKAYIEAHSPGWKNAKHASQWTNTIETYANPVFGSLAVQDVDTGLVLRALEAIWTEKPETASRVRGRLENVLDWATVRGFRRGENPARWRGHLEALLPSREKVRAVRPMPALPFTQAGAFMSELRAREGLAALALEFQILTAARSGEVRGATWEEFDLEAKVWTVPAARMKMKAEHAVPLSPRAATIVERMSKTKTGPLVFSTGTKPLSDMTLASVIKRMNADSEPPTWRDPKQQNAAVVPHGFRSTFRDWAAERTSYASEVVEMALAHAIGNKVEAAYRRGDLFEKRRRLMNEWARFCAETTRAAAVTPIRKSAA
ncbi:tyrosine-type recombinase/integrase [Paraburkholderia sp. HD33-4]|uniref:tyrosine-type recombinase/integrase n=1 Tax=Paraburkholderia sp. HD33-4 TaxID=2883242 RepID=UPI001F491887|nr:site-specific integrase [Paraburkholderia sp. HD33-4]